MQDNDRGEEEANGGEMSSSQKRVAVEDCDEDADVGAKQGEQDASLKSYRYDMLTPFLVRVLCENFFSQGRD